MSAPRTPDEVGPTTPKDLHPTSDIRFVMVEVAKLTERVNVLIEDNKGHRADFRWTWAGLAAGFLVLAAMVIGAYWRVDDRTSALADKLNAIAIQASRTDGKLDDLSARVPAGSPRR